MVGFVTVDPATLYLDQIVVAPEAWGCGVAAALIAEAKRISPHGLDLHVNTDNARAIRFYEKHGFAHFRRGHQLALRRAGPQDELAAVSQSARISARPGKRNPGSRTQRLAGPRFADDGTSRRDYFAR